MPFMMLIKAEPSYEAGRPPDAALVAAIGKLSEAMPTSGVLLQSGGCCPAPGARACELPGEGSP